MNPNYGNHGLPSNLSLFFDFLAAKKRIKVKQTYI